MSNVLQFQCRFIRINEREDRHFGNFGVLRDNHTGRIIATTPIFDNGLSLFCFAGREDIPNLAEYAKTRTTPYGVTYEEVCMEVMGAKQKEQLRRVHELLSIPTRGKSVL